MPTVSRVRPMMECGWLDTVSDTGSLVPRSAQGGDGGATAWGVEAWRPCHNYEARRAFLRSYKFSVRESFTERVVRWMKELNVEVMAVLRGIPSRVSLRRPGCRLVRVLRQRTHLLSLSPVRCFMGRK